MGRMEENKQLKQATLMDTAFQLFTLQGIAKTSIADIAQRAGVAKGSKSEQLFQHALEQSGYQDQPDPTGKLLTIIDDVLYQLRDNKLLLQFINKNLSWGVFRRAIGKWEPDYPAIFEEILGPIPSDRKSLAIEVYTILELVGSTCYTVILNGDPVDLDTYLPYLHRSILAILDSFSAT